MLPLAIVLGAAAVVAVIGLARWLEAKAWRRSLASYQLTLPRSVDEKQLTAWFTAIAGITHRPNWSLLPLPPVVIETVAARSGISHRLLVSTRNRAAVLSALQANVPGVRLEEVLGDRPLASLGLELKLTSRSRPLAIDRSAATATSLLASLQPMPVDAELVLQLAVTSAGTPSPVRPPPGRGSELRVPWLIEGETPVDAEAVGQLRKKYGEPLLEAVLRVGVAGANQATTQRLIGRSWSAWQSLNAPGVRVVRRFLPARTVASRLQRLTLPWFTWPLLINAREALGLSGLPLSALHLPGLRMGGARQLPAPAELPQRGLVLATSNYPGQHSRRLALGTSDRLRHSYCVGPTGSGKSWLLASCILQDIRAKRGVFVVDVKGDLVRDVLARVEGEDADRVIVIDPTNRSRPVGLNVLANTGGEAARELAVDNVVHIFRELWKSFWGPRTDWIMRSGLNTLALARTPDGGPFTLVELSPLLTDRQFRAKLLATTPLPHNLTAFWQRYDAMSDGERSQVIGPSLNKLDAFTSRTAMRLLLGQAEGVDLGSIFTDKAVVLVSLDKGQLGAETANLFGALSVANLWQATLRRAVVPIERRRPAFAYIDEAQDLVRLPLAIADMLAQARGYGLGLTLANQYVGQLPDTVRGAILGTVRNQISFAVDYEDARLLERRFAPLTSDDLQGLGAFEVAIRPTVAGNTLTPVTGTTLPLGEPTQDPDQLLAAIASRYGVDRAQVEAAMAARLGAMTRPSAGFGRELRGSDR